MKKNERYILEAEITRLKIEIGKLRDAIRRDLQRLSRKANESIENFAEAAIRPRDDDLLSTDAANIECAVHVLAEKIDALRAMEGMLP